EDQPARLERVGPAGLAIDTEQLEVLDRMRAVVIEPRHPRKPPIHATLTRLTAAILGRPDGQDNLGCDLRLAAVHRAPPLPARCCTYCPRSTSLLARTTRRRLPICR